MKTILRFLFSAVILLQVIFLSSCQKRNIEPAKGLAEFSVNLPPTADLNSPKGSDSTVAALQLMFSIVDQQGNAIFTDKLVPIYAFGTGYLSDNIEMKAGDLRLTKFMIVNASGQVIYAAPLKGSPMSYLVTRSLPLEFRVTPDQVTKITTELLEVKDLSPEQFGYANFGISIIKPLEFWTYCIVENAPGVMAPIRMTSAKLTVSIPPAWKYSFQLGEKINHLNVRGGAEIYYFKLEKDGYMPQEFKFTAAQLAASTSENAIVLKIPYTARLNTLLLQPGPEKGIDAMISNLEPDKNFGDHKYFEATFLSESQLTVMRSNRSLIRFNTDSLPEKAVIRKVILTLRYDVPIPFDASYLNTGVAWYGAVFQNITEPWDEHKVTWNNQPKTTEAGQVYLAPFVKNSNGIELDVTRLFVPVTSTSASPVSSYGIMFKLWPTDKFPGFRFASSDYPVEIMRPRLMISYSL